MPSAEAVRSWRRRCRGGSDRRACRGRVVPGGCGLDANPTAAPREPVLLRPGRAAASGVAGTAGLAHGANPNEPAEAPAGRRWRRRPCRSPTVAARRTDRPPDTSGTRRARRWTRWRGIRESRPGARGAPKGLPRRRSAGHELRAGTASMTGIGVPAAAAGERAGDALRPRVRLYVPRRDHRVGVHHHVHRGGAGRGRRRVQRWAAPERASPRPDPAELAVRRHRRRRGRPGPCR